ncbi:hypothetical protein [Streptomyces huiliensis]|uniref:hypothetical protein n=1 Tax=Streptomyces huiliensis TaxID=2876027 RepID=UPI001CBBF35A|nr:hypothetical protein [Streptomyces huiliensis]MBZ4321266.1 hypothetical protein [Streptomyces huiliensis]
MAERQELRIPARYNGPPDSGHGGYVSGRFAALAAAHQGATATVTLAEPVPLEEPLAFRSGTRRSTVTHGTRLIATVAPGRTPADPPPAVDPATARRASARFTGRAGHPFPTCFACGDGRPDRDGLGLTPGPVDGLPGTVATPWTPADEEGADGGPVPAELVWSALDCPGGWTDDPLSRPRLLSRMTAVVLRPPRAGEPCVVVARRGAADGRLLRVDSALYTAAAELLASATATWTALARPGTDVSNPPGKDTA